MNQRLEQLRLEASYYAKERHADDIVEWSMCMSEKFADLIVRECANIGDQAEPYKAYDNILKHFGIQS